ncbi:hypothetical protein ACU4GD_31375 [Cupriavidus basilensis]
MVINHATATTARPWPMRHFRQAPDSRPLVGGHLHRRAGVRRGFAQFLATWLIDHPATYRAPALYVIGCGMASLAGLAMVRETAGKPLD